MPNQPATNVKTPTFEWTTSDWYDWIQTILRVHGELVPSSGNTRWTRWPRWYLEYILNFLSTTGHQEWNQWTPASVTTDDVAATKKSAKSFLDHLASQMDHSVPQICQICQMKDVQIKPRETPDELLDHLRALANRCSFPTDEEKGMKHPIPY